VVKMDKKKVLKYLIILLFSLVVLDIVFSFWFGYNPEEGEWNIKNKPLYLSFQKILGYIQIGLWITVALIVICLIWVLVEWYFKKVKDTIKQGIKEGIKEGLE